MSLAKINSGMISKAIMVRKIAHINFSLPFALVITARIPAAMPPDQSTNSCHNGDLCCTIPIPLLIELKPIHQITATPAAVPKMMLAALAISEIFILPDIRAITQ